VGALCSPKWIRRRIREPGEPSVTMNVKTNGEKNILRRHVLANWGTPAHREGQQEISKMRRAPGGTITNSFVKRERKILITGSLIQKVVSLYRGLREPEDRNKEIIKHFVQTRDGFRVNTLRRSVGYRGI